MLPLLKEGFVEALHGTGEMLQGAFSFMLDYWYIFLPIAIINLLLKRTVGFGVNEILGGFKAVLFKGTKGTFRVLEAFIPDEQEEEEFDPIEGAREIRKQSLSQGAVEDYDRAHNISDYDSKRLDYETGFKRKK